LRGQSPPAAYLNLSVYGVTEKALASCIRRRREKLGLSVERAAQLTGIEPSQWHALEAGWVPNLESGLLEAIAGTLEVSFPCVLFVADVSSAFQPLPV